MAKSRKSPKHVDPALGALTHDDDAWHAKLPATGKARIALEIVETDESSPPSARALRTVGQWCERAGGVTALVEAALWDYYARTVVKNYRSQLDPKDAALLTPHLDEPSEVWPLVSDLCLLATEERKRLEVRLVGNCRWDGEHGLEIALDASGKARR